MTRDAYQRHEERIITPLPISLGGTGATTSQEALTNLHLVPEIKIGGPDGITPLNMDGLIPVQFLPPADVNSVSINGALSGFGSKPQTFKITDYDFDTVYAISCDLGTISRNHDIVTYTPPNEAGVRTISINGKDYSIQITKSEGIKPTITYPVNNATLIPLKPTLTLSNASTVGLLDTAISSHWEISQSSSFIGDVINLVINTGNKSLCPIATPLALGSIYYARARYEFETLGLTEWSDVISFETTSVSYTPPVNEEAILTATGSAYPWSLSISDDGNTLAVSDSNNRCYIFEKNNNIWSLSKTFIPSDANSNSTNNFGSNVALSGDGLRLAIGDAYFNNYNGKIYIFVKSGQTWVHEFTVQSSDGATNDFFGNDGFCFNYDGTRLFAGCEKRSSSQIGAVYVYERIINTWSQVAILSAPGVGFGASFGNSVSCNHDGTSLIVTAPTETVYSIDQINGLGDQYNQAGAAYIFDKVGNDWVFQKMLVAPDLVAYDGFSETAQMSGDGTRIIVAAPYASPDGTNFTGKCYVFVKNGISWDYEATLINDDYLTVDPTGNGGFGGYQLGFNNTGDVVALGCPYVTVDGLDYVGVIYIFTRTGTIWSQYAKISPSIVSDSEYFGETITMTPDGNTIVVNAGGLSSTNGALYVFS